MTTPAFDDSDFRRGFAHALREVQRGLELAAGRGLTVEQVAVELRAYQDAVKAWRAQPTDRYIEQPVFRPAAPPPAGDHSMKIEAD